MAASACVGIIIGVVQTTPMANDFGAAIKSVVETNRLLALVGIMFCSIVLGMGVPSVVCYLLMATLMGALLGQLGVDPLAAHMFIFYYGMMSMVTPPVALAAYASASIAEAKIMPTAFAGVPIFTRRIHFAFHVCLSARVASDGATRRGAECLESGRGDCGVLTRCRRFGVGSHRVLSLEPVPNLAWTFACCRGSPPGTQYRPAEGRPCERCRSGTVRRDCRNQLGERRTHSKADIFGYGELKLQSRSLLPERPADRGDLFRSEGVCWSKKKRPFIRKAVSISFV